MAPSPPRVLFITSSYPANATDWRSRFILDMLEAIAAQDATPPPIYWGPTGPLPATVRNTTTADDERWLAELASTGGLAHLLRANPLKGGLAGYGFLRRLRVACRRERGAFDVVHANWLQNLLGLPADGTPALATVLGSDFGLLTIPGIPLLLKAAMRRRRCILAPNAGWMAPKLQALFGDVAQVVPVPFGVTAPWYALERAPPSGPRRWLVVARVTRQKIGPLFDWGAGQFGEADELHLLGPMQDAMAIPDWVHYHGPTHPEALRTQWFPQAHGLITLSVHDEGRPQVMLEAMASGLPVVASQQPAHADLVADGATGLLVSTREQFAAALARIAEPGQSQRMGAEARAWVREHIGTWHDTGAHYAKLHASLVPDVAT
ncbi:MAG: glycosyltransferase family 4 protein [Pseudomonadota bacterium]|jgi:glycosyltransferase involved in cell wall biosynthesis